MSTLPPASGFQRLRRARRWTRLSLFWERLWPRLLPLVAVGALFLVVSWFGLWPAVPEWARLALLGLFGLLALLSLLPLASLRFPSHEAVDARLEIANSLPHRPITAQTDRRATGDALSAALWRAHQRRAAERLDAVAARGPAPEVARRDPFALRAALVLALFVAFFYAAPDRVTPVMEAFKSGETRAIERARIDVWVTPPAYTNRPPVFLARSEALAAGGEGGDDAPARREITVPEGSELVVRTVGLADGRLMFDDGSGPAAIVAEDAQDVEGAPIRRAYTYKVERTGTVALGAGERDLAQYGLSVTPDEPPTIAFAEDPAPARNGALELKYTVTDDYAVRSARASVAPVDRAADGAARPLVEPPLFDLPLPRRNTQEGIGRVSRDLTAHPLAGARVAITLEAADDAEQTGRSAPHEMVLPARPFREPLALALVGERRKLALDARRQKDVAERLDIITSNHPEEFIPRLGDYTAIRIAYRRTRNARNDDDLREVLDLLWEIALGIEDGDLSAAERRLRDAQEQLSEALENGASNEEIERLMQELREAMDEFMREMARRAQENPQEAQPLDRNMQELSRRDLDEMMNRIEDLAKSGSRDAARELLAEMQRMMDNLQAGRQQQQGQQQQGQDQFSEQMNKLGEMLRRQQELMDRTHETQRRQQQARRERQQGQRGQEGQRGQRQEGRRQQGQQGRQGQRGQQGQEGQRGQQGQRGQGQQGQQPGEGQPMTPEQLEQALRDLQRQQGQLQRELQEMQQALEGLGMQPSEGLGEAGREMGQAEGRLGQGQPGDAVGNQGRAMEALRQGAQQMMQQLQQMARQRGEQGQQPGQGEGRGNGERRDTDPLGRQTRSRGPQLSDDVKVPDEIDAQRAREILESIRRRLGETKRRKLELDYLDRLLPGAGAR